MGDSAKLVFLSEFFRIEDAPPGLIPPSRNAYADCSRFRQMNFRLSAKPNAGAAALRSKHDFNALVVFFRKHFVGIRSIFQSHPVADD